MRKIAKAALCVGKHSKDVRNKHDLIWQTIRGDCCELLNYQILTVNTTGDKRCTLWKFVEVTCEHFVCTESGIKMEMEYGDVLGTGQSRLSRFYSHAFVNAK